MISPFSSIIDRIYTLFVSIRFKRFGRRSVIGFRSDLILGEEFIEVSEFTRIGRHVQLTAWNSNNGVCFNPSIRIGPNCQIGSYNHITAVNQIIIGGGVLTGKFVTISDNAHGKTGDIFMMDMSPIKRAVYSKGPVIIEDNVWIGDKATILANVKIGKGSIIGANSVVTKDVPPYSIAVGSPARIIRQIDKMNNK